MAGPTVTLTFAGDAKPATTALDEVGDAAENMDSRVSESTSGLDAAGDGFDDAEGKAQGFNDTLSGVTDTMGGVSQIASGDLLGGIMTLGGGLADLAGGISAFVIPVFGQIIASTWAWTTALLANPITWIVLGIVALVAAIVLLIVYWDEVTGAISAGWDWLLGAFQTGWNWIKTNWPMLLAILTGPIGIAVGLIIKYWDDIVSFVKGLPGKIKSAASGMWDGIKDSFRSAVNWLIDKWNGFQLTIGGGSVLGMDIPQVTLDTPNIPRFHTGTSSVPGPPGSEMLAILQAGERVTPAGQAHADAMRPATITFAGPEAILALLRELIVSRGGVDVVFARA